ncbi:MAG: Nif3-like dinuclear metal center hexameric protein, partial [Deltaproteobacteria bacterium]|nr:Nif3-like dinuclear metal center hexameric protein [Deltaproteobacteria bacterium]
DLSREIHTIFVALDPTFNAVQEASRHNAQLVLTHHPLIFKPISQIERNHYPGSVIFEAIKRDISIVCAHTNLDVAGEGINDVLAKKFNLKNVEILRKQDDPEINNRFGLGRIGDLTESVTLSSMILKVKDILSADYLQIVGHEDMDIKRIAVVGGAGGSLLPLAFSSGADLLITGDLGYHNALLAEHMGLAVIDAGHFNTEKAAFDLFADQLIDKLKEKNYGVTMIPHSNEKNPMTGKTF